MQDFFPIVRKGPIELRDAFHPEAQTLRPLPPPPDIFIGKAHRGFYVDKNIGRVPIVQAGLGALRVVEAIECHQGCGWIEIWWEDFAGHGVNDWYGIGGQGKSLEYGQLRLVSRSG